MLGYKKDKGGSIDILVEICGYQLIEKKFTKLKLPPISTPSLMTIRVFDVLGMNTSTEISVLQIHVHM